MNVKASGVTHCPKATVMGTRSRLTPLLLTVLRD